MTITASAQTKILTLGSGDSSEVEVAGSGNRICLRGFGLMEYPTDGSETTVTKAVFEDGGGSEVFSFYSPYWSLTPLVSLGDSPMIFIEIPGDGVLFGNGLTIGLEKVTTRTSVMRTLLQIVYI
jgi:hypothetical protein